MDTQVNFEFTPCCKTPICETCLSRTFETYIQDIIFKSVNCPFCNQALDLHYVRWFLKERHKTQELWRKTKTYKVNCNLFINNRLNLYNRYLTLIGKIEKHREYYITDIKPNFEELLGTEKYYGSCSQCSPKFNMATPTLGMQVWSKLEICDVPKECGNGEGGILVLEPEMFRCVVCKSGDEDYNDGVFKKCPHCGIKTIKPDGCNYIYCGDHRWCFICNERIENNANGHNRHYWTGPGTSPYTNRCRESTNSIRERYIIRGLCDCPACAEHSGRPLCRTLDCMNRTEKFGVGRGTECYEYCEECGNP
jgi:hypothetical protein